MPVFKVDIQTRAGATYLTNVYHVLAESLGAASLQADTIAEIQKATIPSFWVINLIRTSTIAEGDGLFYSKPVNIPGTRPTPGQMLPLFNRFRVTFAINGRRPGTKFLIGVGESDTDGDTLTQSAIDYINANYCEPLDEAVGVVLVSELGMDMSNGVCNQAVGMRQLRRASKRKTPVIS